MTFAGKLSFDLTGISPQVAPDLSRQHKPSEKDSDRDRYSQFARAAFGIVIEVNLHRINSLE
jgi:hypothetical protein